MTSPDRAAELEQSPHWDLFKASEGFIHEGYPFDEGFPGGASPLGITEYELIFRTGERLRASVDFSTQYRAEGLRWAVKQHGRRRSLERWPIVAWRQVPLEETQ